MEDSDAAFLWETEALRSPTPIPPPPSRRSDNGGEADADWVTLRVANQTTGIPMKTLRKWARREYVDSYLAESGGGQLRMVSLADVKNRADYLGREMTIAQPSQPAEERPSGQPSQTEQPPGTMLVPIDAWDKMLLQLGNLHEAGQQLAEARERAAKAETEAVFLKERLGEMRTQLAAGETTQADTPAPIAVETSDDETEIVVSDVTPEEETVDTDEGMTATAYSLEMMKHIYSTWRGRPRR